MTSAHYLLQGMLIGLIIAAPLGPVGLLCVQRALARGWRAGLVTGLGAVTAHALYGGVAIAGLSGLPAALTARETWFHVVVGGVLCLVGARTALARPAAHAGSPVAPGLRRAYASATALALANPLTILSFAALFAGAGLASTGGDPRAGLALLLGDLLGATLWWCLLSSGVGLLRSLVTSQGFRWVHRGVGLATVALGLLTLAGLHA